MFQNPEGANCLIELGYALPVYYIRMDRRIHPLE